MDFEPIEAQSKTVAIRPLLHTTRHAAGEWSKATMRISVSIRLIHLRMPIFYSAQKPGAKIA
jgi:hypothetical protein